MPELCRFFGVIIRMFAEAGAPHHVAHFHAYFQDEAAVFWQCPGYCVNTFDPVWTAPRVEIGAGGQTFVFENGGLASWR